MHAPISALHTPRRQAVRRAVRNAQRILLIVKGNDGQNRPKISSCEIRISCSTFANTVGCTK